MEDHQLTWGVMATSTYSDLHQGSRMVGMTLKNLSAQGVRIPPKMVMYKWLR